MLHVYSIVVMAAIATTLYLRALNFATFVFSVP